MSVPPPFVCMSVCLLHSWVTSKRFKISKYALHDTIERCLQFLKAKFHNPEFRSLPRTSALKTGTHSLSIAKILPIFHYISETVRDKTQLNIIHAHRKWHTGFRLVRLTESGDCEWPLAAYWPLFCLIDRIS